MSDESAPSVLAPSETELAMTVAALRSADPAERDDIAYPQLVRWIPLLTDARRLALGDTMVTRFTDPEVQARTFAALVLAKVVAAGTLRAEWIAAFTRWYRDEDDLRGYDSALGWLHAVAHGSDLLAALGQHPAVDPVPLLALGAARLLEPTAHVFDAMEDDRLGFALALTLTRPELTERQAVDWLDVIAERFESGTPGPVPAEISNTMRTLRVVHLLAARGVRPHWGEPEVLALPHGAAVGERIAEVLRIAAPYPG
ncbi:DUF2785 domain-containing protein [Microbacterium gorillae]|uniref:DUF2785 domain-containing protein n=1 Tax=Microbacterium gorillae TaxID=1231063 RepID=UPI003D95AA9C